MVVQPPPHFEKKITLANCDGRCMYKLNLMTEKTGYKIISPGPPGGNNYTKFGCHTPRFRRVIERKNTEQCTVFRTLRTYETLCKIIT